MLILYTFTFRQSGRSLHEYQNQAKQLFRRMGPDSPPKHSLETGSGQLLFQLVPFNMSTYYANAFSNVWCLFYVRKCSISWMIVKQFLCPHIVSTQSYRVSWIKPVESVRFVRVNQGIDSYSLKTM